MKMVNHYFFDDLNENDLKNANIILFAGKTGAGKTTAINALFNIIKGVKLKDNYRFILIEEIKKPKGQAESQTDGIHLYYLRDYNNEPLIIIDSQGYGDTRGYDKDLEINNAFEFVFSNVIDHINCICFIANSTQNRIDIGTKYIYSCVTALFAEDVTDNFIILATHANKDSMKKPAFVETIVEDADFLKIKTDKKWWYAFDSKCILDNDLDKLTKYSYKELKDFYDNFVKNSFPKSIKNCSIVLSERNSLRRQVNKLQNSFKNLMLKQKNQHNEEEAINKSTYEIKLIQEKIKMVEDNCKDKNPEEQRKMLEQLNEELKNKYKEYNNQTKEVTEIQLVEANDRNTYCNKCKSNCHHPCNCWFTSVGRCKVFGVAGCLGIFKKENICEVCEHNKSDHGEGNFEFKPITRTEKINNDEKIKELESMNSKEKEKIEKEIARKNNEISGLEQQLKDLNNKKDLFEKEKKKNELIKDRLKKEADQTTKDILLTLMELQKISRTIETLALNNKHIKNQNDYIDDLEKKLEDIGDDKKEQVKKLEKIKKMNKAFMETQNISVEDLKDNNKLIEKIKNFVIDDDI